LPMATESLLTNLLLLPTACVAAALCTQPHSAWVAAATLEANTSLLLPAGLPDELGSLIEAQPTTGTQRATSPAGADLSWAAGGQAPATAAPPVADRESTSPVTAGLGTTLLRTGGTLAISEAFAVEAGMSTLAVNRRWAGGQAVVRGEAGAVGREAALYDVTMRLTALDAGPLRLSMLGGVRASSIDARGGGRGRAEAAAFAAVPVTGLAVDLSLTPRTVLRTSAVGGTEGDRIGGGYTEFRVESVTSLSPSTAFSVGWQRMSTDLERGALQASMRRDAVVLELRFRF
jgi:hypothetical protein